MSHCVLSGIDRQMQILSWILHYFSNQHHNFKRFHDFLGCVWECMLSHGWGLLKLLSSTPLLSVFLILDDYPLLVHPPNHIHIWYVSLRVGSGYTCQIWMSCSISKQCFGDSEKKRENNGTEEIGLVTPTPDQTTPQTTTHWETSDASEGRHQVVYLYDPDAP